MAGAVAVADHLALADGRAVRRGEARLVRRSRWTCWRCAGCRCSCRSRRPSPSARPRRRRPRGSAVPDGTAMSMPAWSRPQRMPNGDDDRAVDRPDQRAAALPDRPVEGLPRALERGLHARLLLLERGEVALERHAARRAPAPARRACRRARRRAGRARRRAGSRPRPPGRARARIRSATTCSCCSRSASCSAWLCAWSRRPRTRLVICAVLVGDPLQELRALEQVAEAVGLEDHGERVGRVRLVDLHEPRGEHGARLRRAGCAAARAGRARPRGGCGRRAASPSGGRGCSGPGPAAAGWSDLALHRVDAAAVALDLSLVSTPSFALCRSICCFFCSMRLGQRRRACPAWAARGRP